MKKLCLSIFIFLLGLVMFNNVSATTYTFTCGFTSAKVQKEYEKMGYPGSSTAGGTILRTGYIDEMKFTFVRTGKYDVKITKCQKSSVSIGKNGSGIDITWGDCPYESYVFDFNGREGIDMTQPDYCPDGINIEGNVVKNFDETKSDYVYITGKNYKTPEKDIVKTENVCTDYTNQSDCKNSPEQACLWNVVNIDGKEYKYCNVDKLLYVKCGDAKDIPHQVPQIVSFAVNFLKILTPIILIFISIISLLKAISASNEDEIKKAQKGLVRKIIAAVMVFFVITIVQFVIMKVADSETESEVNKETEDKNLSSCLNCFLNNKCEDSLYYKSYKGSDLTETFLSGK